MQDGRETIRLSRQQVAIGVLALIVAIVAIVVSLLNPEIRQWLGLDRQQKVTPFSVPTVSPAPPAIITKTSTATSMVTPTRTPTITAGTPLAPTATLAPTRLPTPVFTLTGPSTPGARADCPPWKYCAPSLVGHGPGNGAVFTDQHSYVEMSWEAVGTLAPEEDYVVWVSFREGGKPVSVTHQTQGLSWRFPQEYFRHADAPERRYEWNVTVRSQPGYQELSPPTETRYFFWR